MFRVISLVIFCLFPIAAWQLGNFDGPPTIATKEELANISSSIFDLDYMKNKLKSFKDQNNGDDCIRAFLELLLLNPDMKTLQFFDAWGKLPSGMLYGHLLDLGNFDECLAAEKSVKISDFIATLKGKYVLLQFTKLTTSSNDSNPKMDNFFHDTNENVLLSIGSCFPDICSDESISNITNTLLGKASNSSNTTVYIKLKGSVTGETKAFDFVAILSICIFCVIAVLMVLSSTYDYAISKVSGDSNSLLSAFSVLANSRKLFQMNKSQGRSRSNIDCLNGIRVLSMAWVIYGHTHLWATFFPLQNPVDILDWIRNPYAMLLLSGTVSVDSFLLMSGILITWVGLAKLEKSKGRLNILLMYMHRYVRLTPVLAALILFSVGTMQYLGSGPFWSDFTGYLNHNCASNWWITLLYINNYLRPRELCLGHTWYLSVDTQLFLISPFVLLGLYKWRGKFIWILLLLMGASYGCCISTMLTNQFNGVLTGGLLSVDQTVKVYYATHIRMPPWIIGVIVGYTMYHQRDRAKLFSKGFVIVLWCLAISVLVTVLFGPYHLAKDGTDATSLEAAFYEAFGRSSWALSLAWIIYSCQMGYSETVNSILSHPIWQPFARISYVMYLTSVLVQCMNAGLIRTTRHFSNYDMIQTWWSELGITLCVSIVITLAFESPIVAIEKYFLTPRRKPTPPTAPEGETAA